MAGTKLAVLMAVAVLISLAGPVVAGVQWQVEGVSSDYTQRREAFLAQEAALRFDAGITLTAMEQKADEVLGYVVAEEKARKPFLLGENFFYVQEAIEQTNLFSVMKKMPKGGILHVHSTSMVSTRTLVQYFVEEAKDCYLQMGTPDKYGFVIKAVKCFNERPEDKTWLPVLETRSAYAAGPEAFDKVWASQMDITRVHGDIDVVWPQFQSTMNIQGAMILYRPVMEKYMNRAFEIFDEDNVMYAELRHVFGWVYDLEHGPYSPMEEIALIKSQLENYQKKNPSSNFDARVIYCGMRGDDLGKIAKQLDDFLEMRTAHHDFLVAFDLVGQEDLGHTAEYFAGLLETYKQKAKGDLPLMLHDGETVAPNDENVLDAILLDSKRIGHGFNLVNHPALWEVVKQKKILVEVSPISNQVLKLEADVRNHPARALLAGGVAININCDDPASFGYEGVSHDYYAAAASWGLGVQSLKQLHLNAIEHSGVSEKQKLRAKMIFAGRWKVWVEWVAALKH